MQVSKILETFSRSWKRSDIGWWKENTPIRLYHGIEISKLKDILKNGLPDSVQLSLDPDTAYKTNLNKQSKEKRIVVILEFPNVQVIRHMGAELSSELSDKTKYEQSGVTDSEYYKDSEISFKSVPTKYVVGWMKK